MTISDYDYFMRRAAEERAAGDRAEHPEAQRSHLELAQRYESAAASVRREAVAELKK